jgi:hypothetical protein
MTAAPRIALIHATALAIEPIRSAFARHWRGAQCMNILDDSLSADRARDGALTGAMMKRFADLATYARGAGAGGILFTCSAFGQAIEAAGRAAGIPTLKPNEAMFEQALAHPARASTLRLGLLATFEASIASMAAELEELARQRAARIELTSVFVPQAMDDLAAGRAADHHRKIADAAAPLRDCDAVMLAQFWRAAAAPQVQAALPCPVLTSPDCAVLALKRTMAP